MAPPQRGTSGCRPRGQTTRHQPVELLDGRVVIGAFELAFSDAQITTALDAGVDLCAADAIAELGRALDRRAFPPGYLRLEREGWRE
jgi:hypothetical protein